MSSWWRLLLCQLHLSWSLACYQAHDTQTSCCLVVACISFKLFTALRLEQVVIVDQLRFDYTSPMPSLKYEYDININSFSVCWASHAFIWSSVLVVRCLYSFHSVWMLISFDINIKGNDVTRCLSFSGQID